jgi:tetratricopeptide (TPR) repeat protein
VPLEDALPADAGPLDRVARQIEAREYRESINWLESHIETIEAASHRFDPDLVRPLTLLGDALAGQGQHDRALDTYRRALHLNRVSGGLNSPDQIGIVYREAETLKTLGRYRDANDREEYAYHVLTRAHGPLDEALLPGIYHLADWYEETNNVFAARALYEQAIQIIDHHDKLETPEAIPALEGIAESYRLERFPRYYMADLERNASSIPAAQELRHPVTINNFPAGEAALQRIVRIRQNSEPVDQLALAEAVLDLADWYTLFEKTQRAETLYAHAWELMAGIDGFDVVGYFADPALLYFPDPGDPSPPPPEERGERTTGYVEVAFDVTDEGQVRSLDTVASKPDGLMDFRVRKSLRMARYRPMLVDGVPVFRSAYTYRHEFPYYPERTADSDATATANTPAASPGT